MRMPSAEVLRGLRSWYPMMDILLTERDDDLQVFTDEEIEDMAAAHEWIGTLLDAALKPRRVGDLPPECQR